MEASFTRLNRQNRADEQGALEALARQGIHFIQPSDEERQDWERHAASTIRDLSQDEQFSPALLQQIQALIQDYRRQHPD